MSDYFFRVKASDRIELKRVLKSINILDGDGQGDVIPHRSEDCWYEVGRIENWQDPGKWLKEPISGEAYWHYNLRTNINVRKRIKDLAASGNPDTLILDSAKGRWWSLVANGEDAVPVQPKVVWL